MSFRDKLEHYLNDTLGIPKRTRQGLKWNCPICDRGNKYNLEANCDEKSHRYKKVNCWGCTLKGLRTVLSEYSDNDNWRREPEFKTNYSEDYIREEVVDAEVDFPKHTIPYFLNQEVKDYLLKERKLDEHTLHERNVRYCFSKDEKLYNNILFPFYEDGKMIGYSSQNFQTKKYRNHRNLNFIAYGEFIDWDYPVILTEGIYDALSVPNAIPLLGTKLNKALLQKVNDKKIIIAMDNDVEMSYEDKMKIKHKLVEYSAAVVFIFELQFKDLNEYKIKNQEGLKEKLLTQFELLNLM